MCQKVKDQLSGRLSGCAYFLTGYLDTSWSVFFLLCTQIHDDERKMPKKLYDKLSLIKVSKGRSPKALDNLADFSELCQFERFSYAFCYQLLMIVRCFGIFLLDRTGFSNFIIPGSRDIVQVVQTVQIDLQTFCFTEPGSNLAFFLKNIAHNFYKMQKAHVIVFSKIIQ